MGLEGRWRLQQTRGRVWSNGAATRGRKGGASQRSLHNAPIFRLLLKVAVNGTHQCDFNNFCGAVPQHRVSLHIWSSVAILEAWLVLAIYTYIYNASMPHHGFAELRHL